MLLLVVVHVQVLLLLLLGHDCAIPCLLHLLQLVLTAPATEMTTQKRGHCVTHYTLVTSITPVA